MKTIKLLLTDNVDNLGIVGDVVEVRPGYARNYLLPHGLGTTPSQGNINRLAERRKEVEAEMRQLRQQLEELLAKMEGYELTIERSANDQGILFGGVSQHDIAEGLRADGLAVDDRAVRIGQQIKRLDSYMIPITLANDLKTEIKLWVVSDKPAIADQEVEESPAEAEEYEVQAEAPAEEKPAKPRKSRKTETAE